MKSDQQLANLARQNIQNRTAIVTGAASGIGQAVVKELLGRGASVAAVDKSEDVGVFVTGHQDLCNSQQSLSAYIGNVTDQAFCEQVFKEVSAKQGLPRILVPAAGITRDQPIFKIDRETGDLQLHSISDIRLVLEVNTVAPMMWAIQLIAGIRKELAQRDIQKRNPNSDIEGTVVFIGSVSSQGNYGQFAYTASKDALQGVSAVIQMEATKYGITSNVVHPGYTDTPLLRKVPEKIIKEKIIPQVAIGRLLQPEEVAEAICFAISNAAVSGEITACGGFTRPA